MNITVFCGSTAGKEEAYTKAAEDLGRWIAENGHALLYGGAKTGLMGTVSDTVLSLGGRVTGVLPDVAEIQARRHPGLTAYVNTKDMAERKDYMIRHADVYVALPGGPGTLDELTDILCLKRLGLNKKPLVLFSVSGYYDTLESFFSKMQESEFSFSSDFENVLVSGDLAEIARFLETHQVS